MDRLTRLSRKAEKILNPPPSIYEKLMIDNPYRGKTFGELLNLLSSKGTAPSRNTNEWQKCVAALISVPCERG